MFMFRRFQRFFVVVVHSLGCIESRSVHSRVGKAIVVILILCLLVNAILFSEDMLRGGVWFVGGALVCGRGLRLWLGLRPVGMA